MKKVLIIGCSGFIGSHLVASLQADPMIAEIYGFDIEGPENISLYRKNLLAAASKFCFFEVDVRTDPDSWPPLQFDTLYLLAAVHREPGHDELEYYETNVLGALHSSLYANTAKCSEMIFLSSIAVYGGGHLTFTENSDPNPCTSYGISKCLSEKILKKWLKNGKTLKILRPGVVFGPDECGNVSRLVKLAASYGVVPWLPKTSKAGIFVDDLIRLMQSDALEGNIVINAINSGFEFNDFVDAIQANLSRKIFRINIGFIQRFGGLYLLSRLFNNDLTKRISKAFLPNKVESIYSIPVKYTPLKESMKQWKTKHPLDWMD